MTQPEYDAPDAGPQKPAGTKAARPRDAATLILLRRDAAALALLLMLPSATAAGFFCFTPKLLA